MNNLLFVIFLFLHITYSKVVGEQEKIREGDDANLRAKEALETMENNVTIYATSAVEASWSFYKDVSDSNADIMTSKKTEFGVIYHTWWEKFLLEYDYGNVTDAQLIRQFEIQSSIGISSLNDSQLSRLNTLITRMSKSYSSKLCKFEAQCDGEEDEVYGISDVQQQLRTSEDFMELGYYWAEWREKTGTAVFNNYAEYVELMNTAAEENGFAHAGEMWLYPYISDKYSVEDFWAKIDHLYWNQTFPYYKKLHAYVRWHLESNKEFMNRINDNNNLLPVNILGSISAENWQSLYHLIKPYPSEQIVNLTDTLLLHLNSPKDMFIIAEDFYWEIGLQQMNVAYWKNSIFEESDNFETFCIPKMWDLYDATVEEDEEKRFRVSSCAKLTEEELIKIHEDMSITEYAMSYKDQPLVFRRPANPAISVGIAGAMGLSVATPHHLEKIRNALHDSYALKDIEYNEYMAINYLFKQAMKIIPNLSYQYMVEKWRWNVFKGDITPSDYNYEWWKMRIQGQGLKPPFTRTPKDFDVSANQNIGMSSPSFGLFLGNILQFQIYDKLCELSEQTDNKYFCDIYGNKLSGDTLQNAILENGASIPWEEQLQSFLGTKKISADSMILYFDPLFTYIDAILEENGIESSWDTDASQVDDYVKETGDISAAVPITVGCVFAVMVVIVMISFCFGQSKQKRLRRKENAKLDDIKEGSVQMGEKNIQTPNKESGIYTHLDSITLSNRKKKVEEEIKNSLSGSDVESAINISYTSSSAENSQKELSSGCYSESTKKIPTGIDNKNFEFSESDTSRL